MSTDTDKYDVEDEREPRHSALEELARDERRPAVMLLSALLLAAVFFALGIMFGRWTVQTNPQTRAPSDSSAPQPPTSNAGTSSPLASATTQTQARPRDRERRFSLLIENPASREAAQSMVKSLERAGYKDVRLGKRPSVLKAPFPVLIGHYTRDEAEAEATRLRATGGPRLKNVTVIEEIDAESP
ncbi:MAG: SPOR domain-containing protein [Acidobacteria bacterium]|nr:SPOR domain-containing protein [Acidobacteriota bacterium]